MYDLHSYCEEIPITSFFEIYIKGGGVTIDKDIRVRNTIKHLARLVFSDKMLNNNIISDNQFT
ncbi:hypothetical protein NVIRPANT_00918 [Pantoea sp. Nvir]|nr:hypothetical protein NVIRPANT_00918 [Pantoea sp. Nvir]